MGFRYGARVLHLIFFISSAEPPSSEAFPFLQSSLSGVLCHALGGLPSYKPVNFIVHVYDRLTAGSIRARSLLFLFQLCRSPVPVSKRCCVLRLGIGILGTRRADNLDRSELLRGGTLTVPLAAAMSRGPSPFPIINPRGIWPSYSEPRVNWWDDEESLFSRTLYMEKKYNGMRCRSPIEFADAATFI